MAKWHFRAKEPGDTTRDPISGEFFATEAIRNSAEALVREGIQNALDARDGTGSTVRVRIYASGNDGASPEQMTPLVGQLAEHLRAPGNGLHPDRYPDFRHSCPFLVFEDFGTTGLCGDPLQWHHIEGARNGFFAFFRAEGESDKAASDRRGRWGIGKFVFPRASLASTFFGLTVQADTGRALLMGRSILKSHQVAGTYFVPDGYFGEHVALERGPIVAPVLDARVLDHFKRTFRLKRADRPGLSLVVPWSDPEISGSRLVEAAIRDWFFSILTGELEVEISDATRSTLLNAATFRDELSAIGHPIRGEIEPLVRLTEFAVSQRGRSPVVLGVAGVGNAPQWEDALVSNANRELLREALLAERPFAVQLRCVVRPKVGEAREGTFSAYVVRDPHEDKGQPVFVREGIIVSDAKGGRARGCRSLVVCQAGALADLLGDAENPSHTEWRPDTANFKSRYQYGPSTLTFVKQAVRSLMELLQETEDQSDPDLLRDLFSVTTSAMPDVPPYTAPDHDGMDPEPAPGTLPGRMSRYRIGRTADGFSVRRGPEGAPVPAEIIIEVAYAVRRGNAFKRYDTADFQLIRPPLRLDREPRGLEQLHSEGNRLHLKVTDADFFLSVSGFDTNRDLMVRVTARDGG